MSGRGRERGHLDEAVLNGLADGSLRESGRPPAEAHLQGCAECRARLRELRAVVEAAGELPRGIAPPRELWPGIRERVLADGEDAEPGGSGARPHPGPDLHRGGTRPAARGIGDRSLRSARRWLAAAAVLLVAGAAGVTAVLVGGGEGAGGVAPGRSAGAGGVAPASPARVASVEESYRGAVERLSGILQRRGDELPPGTREVLERNLEIIDGAIAEAESALARNPGSPALVRALDRSYRRKIDVLQRSARLAAQL